MDEVVYLARHASPDWERTDLVYHLPPGPPLTPTGQQEALTLGAFLSQAGVRHVFTSPLERCTQTAQIAAGVLTVPLEIHPALIEWQPGDNPSSVYARLRPLFEQAAALSLDGGPAVLVTHGGPISALLSGLGMDEAILASHRTFDHRNPVPPAGVWRARRAQSKQHWELQLVFTPEAGNPTT